MPRGTVMFYDDTPNLAAGTTRGWKVGFGYTDKGTVVEAYQAKAGDPFDVTVTVTEIPKLANGKADVNAIQTWLTGFGVSLTNAVRQVIGA